MDARLQSCVVGSIAVLLACSGVQAQSVAWANVNTTGPTARYQFGMANNTNTHATVLFGGNLGNDVASNETWQWQGADVGWARKITNNPGARFGQGMTYDSTRNVVVMFGGTSGRPNYIAWGDTWEWNGTVWISRPVAGPSGRTETAIAYDAQRGKTILYGGRLGLTYYSDTWEWDGTAGTWTLRNSPTNPGPRAGHSMAYDPDRRVIVMFGGDETCSEDKDETWEWNGNAWNQRVSVERPSARSGQSMVYDANRNVMVMFGGHSGCADVNNETWEWNGVSWTQQPIAGPVPRWGQAMIYEPSDGSAVMFGGLAGPQCPINASGQTWVLHGSCGTSDFNGDGDLGTDADIEAFFACLAGNCCATCFVSGADFNGDGDNGTDGDIEAFFRVLAGGNC